MINPSSIKHHTQLIQYLLDICKGDSYLEIGVKNPANNFNKIICKRKIGVDPDPEANATVCETSDDFFEHYAMLFDVIFLDGLHHSDQIQRDFENSLKALAYGGFIIIHDTLPDEEQYTTVPRATKKWFGDVYKFAMVLGKYRDHIDFRTINIDCGCTVIWKGQAKMKGINRNVKWDTYIADRKTNMRIIEPSEIETFIKPTVEI